MWHIDGLQGFESRKIKYLLPKYTRGRVLEIGCGMEKAFPHFIGYDSGHHFGRGAADIIGSADKLTLFADESFDFVGIHNDGLQTLAAGSCNFNSTDGLFHGCCDQRRDFFVGGA